jgi:hypothetical protein
VTGAGFVTHTKDAGAFAECSWRHPCRQKGSEEAEAMYATND